ncbi:unnamed protein product [Ceratitis capitata]|uniref:(Mediterranean fruit fly) hypothetical protein n=1 Tax=Ceratitis capitata TaxID=7213 RepID=A0A811VGW5_CERCA|nr:unnamed protein product [Ceratitis capitata]
MENRAKAQKIFAQRLRPRLSECRPAQPALRWSDQALMPHSHRMRATQPSRIGTVKTRMRQKTFKRSFCRVLDQ